MGRSGQEPGPSSLFLLVHFVALPHPHPPFLLCFPHSFTSFFLILSCQHLPSSFSSFLILLRCIFLLTPSFMIHVLSLDLPTSRKRALVKQRAIVQPATRLPAGPHARTPARSECTRAHAQRNLNYYDSTITINSLRVLRTHAVWL